MTSTDVLVCLSLESIRNHSNVPFCFARFFEFEIDSIRNRLEEYLLGLVITRTGQ